MQEGPMTHLINRWIVGAATILLLGLALIILGLTNPFASGTASTAETIDAQRVVFFNLGMC
jgi:hypothetical protein